MLPLENYDDIVNAINALRGDGTSTWLPATIATLAGVVAGWGLSWLSSIWARNRAMKDEVKRKRETALNAVGKNLLWLAAGPGSRRTTEEWQRRVSELVEGEGMFHMTGERLDSTLAYSFDKFKTQLIGAIHEYPAEMDSRGIWIPISWDANERSEYLRGEVGRLLGNADEWLKGERETMSLASEIEASGDRMEHKRAEFEPESELRHDSL